MIKAVFESFILGNLISNIILAKKHRISEKSCQNQGDIAYKHVGWNSWLPTTSAFLLFVSSLNLETTEFQLPKHF